MAFVGAALLVWPCTSFEPLVEALLVQDLYQTKDAGAILKSTMSLGYHWPRRSYLYQHPIYLTMTYKVKLCANTWAN